MAISRARPIRSETVPSDRNGVPFPPVRRLRPDDLRHCVRLSVDRIGDILNSQPEPAFDPQGLRMRT